MPTYLSDVTETVNPFEIGKFLALRGKHPEGNWRDAPPLDLSEIEARTAQGLYVGFAPNPGYVIVDLDVKNGGNLEALIDECIAKGYLPEREILNTTWHQDTQSGGRHYLFVAPLGIEVPQRTNLDRTLQHGQIDLRVGGKGYIVIAPSAGYTCNWSLTEPWPVTVTISEKLLEAAGVALQNTNTDYDLGEPSEHLRISTSILDELSDEQIVDLCRKLLQLQPTPHVGVGLRDLWRNTAWALQDIAKMRPAIATELANLWIDWSLSGAGAPDRITLEREWQKLDRVPPNGKRRIGAGSLLQQVTPEILNTITKPRRQQKTKAIGKDTLTSRAFDCLISSQDLIFFNGSQNSMVSYKKYPHPNVATNVTSQQALSWYLTILTANGLGNITYTQLQNTARKIACYVESMRPHYPVALRSYYEDGASYMLVGSSEKSRILKVDKDGYKFVQMNNCFFKLGRHAVPLPEPMPGDPKALIKLLDLFMLDRLSKSLLVAWMLSALRGAPPHPVCVLYGGAGAAKSTLARTVRRLVDPQRGEQLNFIQHKRFNDTVHLTAAHEYVVVLDNAGRLDNEQLDELCVMSTGGAIKKRALYTDEDIHSAQYNNPVLITTINNTINRSDALSRCIIVEMNTIPMNKRQPLDMVEAQINQLLPYAFENLLQLMVRGYQHIDAIKQQWKANNVTLPRMAEFTIWGEACGITNLRIVTEQQQSTQQRELLLQNPVAKAVIKLIEDEGDIDTSITILHRKLKRYIGRVIPMDKFPANSTHLGRILRQNQAAMVAMGYEVTFSRSKLSRNCIIKKTDKSVSLDFETE